MYNFRDEHKKWVCKNCSHLLHDNGELLQRNMNIYCMSVWNSERLWCEKNFLQYYHINSYEAAVSLPFGQTWYISPVHLYIFSLVYLFLIHLSIQFQLLTLRLSLSILTSCSSYRNSVLAETLLSSPQSFPESFHCLFYQILSQFIQNSLIFIAFSSFHLSLSFIQIFHQRQAM